MVEPFPRHQFHGVESAAVGQFPGLIDWHDGGMFQLTGNLGLEQEPV